MLGVYAIRACVWGERAARAAVLAREVQRARAAQPERAAPLARVVARDLPVREAPAGLQDPQGPQGPQELQAPVAEPGQAVLPERVKAGRPGPAALAWPVTPALQERREPPGPEPPAEQHGTWT